MKFLQLFIVALLNFTLVNSKSYRNYKVVTFKIENEEQLKEVQTLQMQPGVKFIFRNCNENFINFLIALSLLSGIRQNKST